MEIKVNRDGEVPIREQLTAQLVFQIGTQQLKPGDLLPSVRALARRLGVHHNTISQAYQDLIAQGFVTGQRGRRLKVRFPTDRLNPASSKDLDDLIDDLVNAARRQGFSMQQLRRRLRERLSEAAPDHLLAVSDEAAMRELLRAELAGLLSTPVETCSTDDLAANPALAFCSLLLVPPGNMPRVLGSVYRGCPTIPIVYSDPKPQLELIRESPRPAMVAVVSISEYFLEISRGVLTPVISNRHALAEFLLRPDQACPSVPADIVIADSIVFPGVRSAFSNGKVVGYRLISEDCLLQVRLMLDAAREYRPSSADTGQNPASHL